MNIEIVATNTTDSGELAPLFLEYANGSVSKERELTVTECRAWIQERCSNGEGVFFLAKSGAKVVGFITLYSGFSSIALRKHWILNDLFVLPDYRNSGIGSRLIDKAHEFAIETNAESVELETAKVNIGAQKMYENLGYEEETSYKRYYWFPGKAL
jgi:ribosomal protein S18 acetylase RimI-like enzyme